MGSDPVLTTDLHVHSYGCLSPKTIAELLQTHTPTAERIAWYTSEFAKAYGRTPEYSKYLSDYQALEYDYLVNRPVSFAQFQASLNLVIALFPATPAQTSFVLEKAMEQDVDEGLSYVEYRNYLPEGGSAADIATYLSGYCTAARKFQSSTFTPAIIASVSRQNVHLRSQLVAIRRWQQDHPDLSEWLVALDFCGAEEPHPPHEKEAIFKNFLAENADDPKSSLALTYHVGETYENRTLMSAMRWVWQAAQLRAHRLGHATALGMNPKSLLGQTVSEPRSERGSHLRWLIESQDWLAEYGYQVAVVHCQKELLDLETRRENVNITYTEDLVDDCWQLQEALMRALKESHGHLVIESCPSSNLILAKIADPADHPLPRFLENGLKVCIGRDDPGIFGCTLQHEASIARDRFGLTTEQISQCEQTALAARSKLLTGREGP